MKYAKLYGKSIKTNPQSKLNEDTMATKQKSPEEEPTPKQDSAVARLVKRNLVTKMKTSITES